MVSLERANVRMAGSKVAGVEKKNLTYWLVEPETSKQHNIPSLNVVCRSKKQHGGFEKYRYESATQYLTVERFNYSNKKSV